MKSTAFCLPAVNNGLNLLNQDNAAWHTANAEQDHYLETYKKSFGDIVGLDTYLKGKVTTNATELAEWFATHGWDIQVNIPAGGIGVGSVFDLLVDWDTPGEKTYLWCTSNDTPYRAATMDTSASVRAYSLEGHEHPLFSLSTRADGWEVFLIEDETPCAPVDLPRRAADLLALKRTKYSFEKLIFPVVDMNTSVDVDWLQGMHPAGGPGIEQAIKMVRLRLDDKGARAQSAVAFTTRGAGPRNVYTIEKPFYVIFWRKGLSFPAFVAHSYQDSWVKKN